MMRHRRARAHAALATVLATALVAGACSGDDGEAADDTTGSSRATATTGTATTAPAGPATTAAGGSGTTSGAGAGDGCTGDAPPVPDGAAEGEVADVDGDGRADRAYLATGPEVTRLVGIVTAAGGGAQVEVESASPQPLSLLVVDADEAPPVELFVSDGRTVQLWAFADCAVAPVTNPEGAQYEFDLGFRGTGTGIGCREGGGGRQLVGLNVTEDDGTTVTWTRTVIERDGLAAANGATDGGTFAHGEDDAAIELLHTVSCGGLTIREDGIRQPQA